MDTTPFVPASRPLLRTALRLLFTLLAAAMVAGCGGGGGGSSGSGDDSPATASVTLAIGFAGDSTSAQALATSASDVASVTIDVADGEDVLETGVALTLAGSAWSGTLADLPAGVLLTFTAHAFDASDAEIFSGTAQATLSAEGPNSVTINLAPVDGGDLTLPKIVSIAVPSEITASTSATVLISLEGSASETLSWTLTAAGSGGSFSPASGTIPLATDGTATLTVTYTAPATAGAYTHTMEVTNSAGNAVEGSFPTNVVEATASGGVSVLFPPVVTAMKGSRLGSTVTWTATAEGDGGCCAYAWGAALTDGSSPALRAPTSTNPAFLDNYSQAVNGTVSVQVTDGTGLSTTATVALPAGQFPDALTVSGIWTPRAPMGQDRIRHATVVANGLVHVLGGLSFADSVPTALSSVEAYNPVTNAWTARAVMPTTRAGFGAAAVDGVIYTFGGGTLGDQALYATNAVEAYTIATNTWSTKAPLPAARVRHCAVAVNGLIYVFGGVYGSSDIDLSYALDIYNPASDTWSTGATMPGALDGGTGLSRCAAAVVDGVIHAFDTSGLSIKLSYSPATDAWSAITWVPGVPYDFGIAALDGLVYLLGGYDFDDPSGFARTRPTVYDPGADTYTALPLAPWPPSPPLREPSAAALNGLLYVMGGFLASPSDTVATVDAFTP